VSELDSPWSRAPLQRFGAHQFQEHMEDTLICCAWFAGGLRIVDVADPSAPREVGYFIPQPAAGKDAPQTNDVDTDGRGLIYIVDRHGGFDILEFARG
jgi:LVIVD repeat-containing protein